MLYAFLALYARGTHNKLAVLQHQTFVELWS